MLILIIALVAAARLSPITAADVRAITVAVVDEMVPPTGKLGARPTSERSLLFGQNDALSAFQKLAVSGRLASIELTRKFQSRERNEAILCTDTQKREDCQVVGDGIFVTISDAELVESTGEVRVRSSATWTATMKNGTHHLDSYRVDLFLARVGSDWKVVRRGPAAVP